VSALACPCPGPVVLPCPATLPCPSPALFVIENRQIDTMFAFIYKIHHYLFFYSISNIIICKITILIPDIF
jgi:hypothetical protein